ncbi:hypothetical protein WHZ78_07655 [Bradyrhizobium symbiodeficiens]|uniref:hypothetical protein n=1 Tax=Bradyrhizobium symbiodeficiens TaxID=1404367 RepID=UPI0030CABB12
MSNQMPDSITLVLLAALNAADELVEQNSDLAGPISVEALPVARALAGDRPNRFAATICLSMKKFRSLS